MKKDDNYHKLMPMENNNQYKGNWVTGEKLFNSFDVRQWKHFRYDHQVPDKFSHGYQYKDLPSYIQQRLELHAKMGQYEKGANIKGFSYSIGGL